MLIILGSKILVIQNQVLKKMQHIQQEIQETLGQKEECEKMKHTAECYLAEDVAMEKHVEKIYEQRVFKRVTFWQNLLNMVLMCH